MNRKLVTTLLEKRGHAVDAVENGRAAVDALAAAPDSVDVVLMDLQMPEMGGLEATQAIRERERATGTHVPIVALTAHAMAGDRERCLASGMDGYLSKPVDVNDLMATVEAVSAGGASGGSEAVAHRGAALFDEAAALAYAGGDRKLLREVIKLFRSACPASLRRLHRAIRSRDSEALRLAAHALKGAVATVGSSAGKEKAAELERLARSNRFGDAERVYDELRDFLKHLDAAFVKAQLTPRAKTRIVAGSRRKKSTVRRRS
jgi:two-component system sensor histidine kinase/response regulator